MENYAHILDLIAETKQQGGDIDVLASSIQTLVSGGKTPLGLNQWVKTDKPTMEDFNKDNQLIDKEIRELKANKANGVKSKLIVAQAIASNATNKLGANHYAVINPDYSTVLGKSILSCNIVSVYDDTGASDATCLGGFEYEKNLISKIIIHSNDYRTCRVKINVLYTD